MSSTPDTPATPVRTAVADGVATITLADVEGRNAMTPSLLNGLGDALAEAIDDPETRAVVLTNDGSVFCAGADLKGTDTTPTRYGLEELLATVLDSPTPVIGRIAGHCMGGGVGLAAACDISIVADDARFGFTEVRLGVAPAIISVVCLPKMRRADAMELFLSGERVPAARAAEVGLVNRAVAPNDLDEAVRGVIDNVTAGGPAALAAAKDLVNRVPGQDRAEAFTWTAALSAALFASTEAQEGIAAFRERRRAAWVPSPPRH